MENIKPALTTWNWLKIGYSSWLHNLARRIICFNKKFITFQWNVEFFHKVCFFEQLEEDEKNVICKKS